jgi:hypothetical protein
MNSPYGNAEAGPGKFFKNKIADTGDCASTQRKPKLCSFAQFGGSFAGTVLLWRSTVRVHRTGRTGSD